MSQKSQKRVKKDPCHKSNQFSHGKEKLMTDL